MILTALAGASNDIEVFRPKLGGYNRFDPLASNDLIYKAGSFIAERGVSVTAVSGVMANEASITNCSRLMSIGQSS